MSILDLQRRHRELGRLRMGDKGPKGNPIKLNTWRLTSPDRRLIDAAAELWGGEVEMWGEKQWEVVTDISRIPVRIPPQHPDPEYQLWSRAGLQRRCNGAVCYVASSGDAMLEQPCICAESESRECKPHTRFEFILPDLPDIGIWALTSTGYNAASELAASVQMLAGTTVEAHLGIEHRESRKPGSPVKQFTVAVLQTSVSLRSLLDGGGALGGGLPFPAVTTAPSLPPSTPSVEGPSGLATEHVHEGMTVSEVGEEPDGPSAEVIEIVPHISTAGARFEDLAARAQEQAWTQLLAEIENEPDDSWIMDDIERGVRSMFRRMETVGLWPDADRALHASLAKNHGAKHVSDLRKAELVAFAKSAWAAAREAIANADE